MTATPARQGSPAAVIPFDPRTWATVGDGDLVIVQETRGLPYRAIVMETRPAEPAGGHLVVRRPGFASTRRINAASVLRVLARAVRS